MNLHGNRNTNYPLEGKDYRILLVNGFQEWATTWVNKGYDPYLINFMFRQLPGKGQAVLEQMRGEIERVYAKLAMQFDDHPGSQGRQHRLPQLYLFPDLPVFKHKKKSIRDVSVNDGLHYNGIVLIPFKSKFRGLLDDYFLDNQHVYRTDKLERIEVNPITHNIEDVVDYAAKTFKRGKIDYDTIIILPKSVSELPGNGPWSHSPFRAPQPEPVTVLSRRTTDTGDTERPHTPKASARSNLRQPPSGVMVRRVRGPNARW